MAKPPKNGIQMAVFLTEVGFRHLFYNNDRIDE